MMKKNYGIQQKMIVTTLENLMPQEHFLRDLDELVDFSFIYKKVENLYSNTGRNSIDPVVIIKMLLLGYLYGINSERRLEKEIQVNIAYRWFLGIDLDEAVPDHSTLSQLRKRKFKGTNIFEEIFDEIVRKCINVGLVTGSALLTDSTHVRANARNDLRETIEVEDKPSKYVQKLDEEALANGKAKPQKNKEVKTKMITKSITDPDCGLLNRPSKPRGFYYLNHQSCDANSGIITDVYVTPANVSDNTPYADRISYQIEKFKFDTKEICADSGYYCGEIHKEMFLRGVKTYIPLNKEEICSEEKFSLSDFKYNENEDYFICPNNKKLTFKCYQLGYGAYRYKSSSKDCRVCDLKEKCTNQPYKQIQRRVNFKYTDIQNKNVGTYRYDELMRLRKIWCEGNFSHQKANHNLSRLSKRGIENASAQCLLSACALNLKRLIKYIKTRNSMIKQQYILMFFQFHKTKLQALRILSLQFYF